MARIHTGMASDSDFLSFIIRLSFTRTPADTEGPSSVVWRDAGSGEALVFRGTFAFNEFGDINAVDIDRVFLLDGGGEVLARLDEFPSNFSSFFLDINGTQDGATPPTRSAILFRNSAPVFFTGNDGDDTAFASRGADTVFGGAGDDLLGGGGGNDLINGGEGDDTLGASTDPLFGPIFGDIDRDILIGGRGRDAASYEYASAGVSADLRDPASNTGDATGDIYRGIEDLIGSAFNDILSGDAAANRLAGAARRDRLDGRAGNDTLDGGDGDDLLIGGAGADSLSGGAGEDAFRYRAVTDGGDTIADFTAGEDLIEIIASGFGGALVAGTPVVDGVTFFVDATPTTPGVGAFLFETAIGALSWDADGAGSGVAVVLLTAPGASMTAADLVLI